MEETTFVQHLVTLKRSLEAMLTAMVGDATIAEDLFQEAAVVMTRKRTELPEDADFGAWARAIAYNMVREQRRRWARSKERTLSDEALENVKAVFDRGDASLWDMRRRALDACLKQLPERQRDVMERRYAGAEDVASIARSMKLTRGALDTQIYRIRRALADCIGKRIGAGGPLGAS